MLTTNILKYLRPINLYYLRFSMTSIKPGVYFLNIIYGNKEEVLKIVKE